MRHDVDTGEGVIPADVVALTVNRSPGYRMTIPGYAATATFERSGGGWLMTLSAPGKQTQEWFILDVRYREESVISQGAPALARYIERMEIPLRTGQADSGEPPAPVDRDAKWRTPPTHRRAGKYGDKWRKNHRGPLGSFWDTLVDVFLD